MKVILPSFEIKSKVDHDYYSLLVEEAGRVCWKSEDKIQEGSADPFIKRIIGIGHESVLEHASISVKIICDRGVSHELVRHRLCSFSQESTRYANYSKGKFESEITVIKPLFFDEDSLRYRLWYNTCLFAEQTYLNLIEDGAKAEEARSVLPNSLKTEVFCTANIREWRHVFNLRCDSAAHPQMREIMRPMLAAFYEKYPAFFADVNSKYNKE